MKHVRHSCLHQWARARVWYFHLSRTNRRANAASSAFGATCLCAGRSGLHQRSLDLLNKRGKERL